MTRPAADSETLTSAPTAPVIGAPANGKEKTPIATVMPRHLAIIMDGNGRWAKARGLPRTEGHRHGVESVRRIVREAGNLGIPYLTLFGFSSENWARPEREISFLFDLMRGYIRRDLKELNRSGVRISIIGSRLGLPTDIIDLIENAETETRPNERLRLQIAFNYGARDEIVRATRKIAEAVLAGDLVPADIDAALISDNLDTGGMPEPDLLVRTSGEQRISNFLLWQCAYTEFVFDDALWPDFGAEQLHRVLNVFAARSRRFGGVSAVKT